MGGRSNNTGSLLGEHVELQGYFYTYNGSAGADQYKKTAKKVALWAKRELLISNDGWKTMPKLQDPDKDPGSQLHRRVRTSTPRRTAVGNSKSITYKREYLTTRI